MPDPKPDFTLSDALTHFRSIIDNTHRFITYFQVVTVAVVSLVISNHFGAEFVTYLTIGGYVLFSAINGWLAVSSQGEARIAWNGINSAAEKSEVVISKDLKPLLSTRKPARETSLASVYVIIVVSAVGAMSYAALLKKPDLPIPGTLQCSACKWTPSVPVKGPPPSGSNVLPDVRR